MELKQLNELIAQDNLVKFYKCKEWRRLRLEALIRDNNECQLCKSKGKYKRAENVHHIKEVKTHPHLALTLDNLQCLCIRCHNEVHDRLEQEKNKIPKFMNVERW